VRAAGYVVDEKALVRSDGLEFPHVLHGLVGHGGGQVPAGTALEGIDGCRIAEEVRLPLAGVTAGEAIKVLEAHAVRPLVDRPGLGRLIEGRVVVLAEPRVRHLVRFAAISEGRLQVTHAAIHIGEAVSEFVMAQVLSFLRHPSELADGMRNNEP
jgi:hypothetical protein